MWSSQLRHGLLLGNTRLMFIYAEKGMFFMICTYVTTQCGITRKISIRLCFALLCLYITLLVDSCYIYQCS